MIEGNLKKFTPACHFDIRRYVGLDHPCRPYLTEEEEMAINEGISDFNTRNWGIDFKPSFIREVTRDKSEHALLESYERVSDWMEDIDQGENDGFVRGVLDRLEKLCAEPKHYDRLVANDSHEYAAGSIFGNRKGFEECMIVELWNDLYCVEECDTEALHEQGLLNPEDDFGDNPEYMNAKKLWWEQKMGIRGIEAIARYHVGHVRSRRRLHRAAYFLIEEDDATLNYNSPEYLASRAEPEDVHKEYQFYNELHDSPVDWTAKSGCWIRLWRLSVTEIIPHNDFEEGYSEAYDALVEYQDSREPGCEAHEEPEEFARPLLTGRCVPTLATLERNRRDSYVQLKSMTSTVGVDLGDHHIPGSIPAAYRMVKDNASVSNSADRSSGRLIKHTGAVRDDEVVNPTGAVANAPSPKFFKAFLEKKAFGRAVNSSIQVPPGILSASPAVGIDIPDRDPDNLCNLIQQNAPGPVPIEGRVWVGLSNPEVSCYQHREQQDTTIRDHMALSRPRNDAENQLMGLLHLPVSKADSMHRPRRE